MADFELSVYAINGTTSQAKASKIPFHWPSPAVMAEIDRLFVTGEIPDAATPPPDWPGPEFVAMGMSHPPTIPTPRLYEFFYPAGMSRWATFRGLMHADNIALFKQYKQAQIGGDDSSTYNNHPCTLAIQEGNNLQEYPYFYMLPPRPLLGAAGVDDLFLVTLVDDRYWKQFKQPATGATVPNTQWTFFTGSFTVPGGVDAAYVFPDPDSPLFSVNRTSESARHDAIAANIGRVITRNIDGSGYTLQTFFDAAQAYVNARAGLMPESSGGGEVLNADLNVADFWRHAAVPETITFYFRNWMDKVGQYPYSEPTAEHTETSGSQTASRVRRLFSNDGAYTQSDGYTTLDVTASSLGGRWVNYATNDQTVSVWSSCKARIDDASSSSERTALAQRLAKDYFDNWAYQIDEIFRAALVFDPLAGCDHLIRYGPEPRTRVIRDPRSWYPRYTWHVPVNRAFVEPDVYVRISGTTSDRTRQPCVLQARNGGESISPATFTDETEPCANGYLLLTAKYPTNSGILDISMPGIVQDYAPFPVGAIVQARRLSFGGNTAGIGAETLPRYVPVDMTPTSMHWPGSITRRNQYLGRGAKYVDALGLGAYGYNTPLYPLTDAASISGPLIIGDGALVGAWSGRQNYSGILFAAGYASTGGSPNSNALAGLIAREYSFANGDATYTQIGMSKPYLLSSMFYWGTTVTSGGGSVYAGVGGLTDGFTAQGLLLGDYPIIQPPPYGRIGDGPATVFPSAVVLSNTLVFEGTSTNGQPSHTLRNGVTATLGGIQFIKGICVGGGAGGGLAVGSTLISGGTNGRILFDNAGVLGEPSGVRINGSGGLENQLSGSRWLGFSIGSH